MKIFLKNENGCLLDWIDLNIGQMFKDQDGDIMMVVSCESPNNNDRCLIHWAGASGPFLCDKSVERVTTVKRLIDTKEVELV